MNKGQKVWHRKDGVLRRCYFICELGHDEAGKDYVLKWKSKHFFAKAGEVIEEEVATRGDKIKSSRDTYEVYSSKFDENRNERVYFAEKLTGQQEGMMYLVTEKSVKEIISVDKPCGYFHTLWVKSEDTDGWRFYKYYKDALLNFTHNLEIAPEEVGSLAKAYMEYPLKIEKFPKYDMNDYHTFSYKKGDREVKCHLKIMKMTQKDLIIHGLEGRD